MSNYLVIDLEMCRVPKGIKRQDLHLSSEIIQIGAVLLDDELKVADTFQSFVKPQQGVIDRKIQNLTGISQKDVANAPCFEQAVNSLISWMPEDTVIVSWSDSDLFQLQKEFNAKDIDTAYFERYFESWVDCQKTFSKKMHTEKVYRLSEALVITDIFYDENTHNALVDAHNTADLFVKMETEDELVLSPYYSNSINCIYDSSDSLLGNYMYA